MKSPSKNSSERSDVDGFQRPVFPERGSFIHRIWKRSCDIASSRGMKDLYAFIVMSAFLSGMLIFPIFLDYTTYSDSSNIDGREVRLSNGTFIVIENGIELETNFLHRGDVLSFYHDGMLEEIERSSTSCEAGATDEYGYYEEGECWTSYWTEYILNASSHTIETEELWKVYSCHKSECYVQGQVHWYEQETGRVSMSIMSVEVLG